MHLTGALAASPDGSKFLAKTTGVDSSGQLMAREGQLMPMPLGDPHLVVDYKGCEYQHTRDKML